jgi:hypothetical protein
MKLMMAGTWEQRKWAKRRGAQMWFWLTRNPSKRKGEWPLLKETKEEANALGLYFIADCTLCSVRLVDSDIPCDSCCPLQTCEGKGLYKKYMLARGEKFWRILKSFYAFRIFWRIATWDIGTEAR